VMTWPVDDLDTLDHVVGLGVDAVITNEPDILGAVRLRNRG
jgi:glycerophosphoryl diester phosphodiesterase